MLPLVASIIVSPGDNKLFLPKYSYYEKRYSTEGNVCMTETELEEQRELPRTGLPATMFDRLGVLDTFGQGAGMESLKPKIEESGATL